jgi:hypothetical protein
MPCLSPFKKFIEDLFEAYDASGPSDNLDVFMDNNADSIIQSEPVEFGIYPTPEYCCPSCDAIDDPCGNIYFLGNVNLFIQLAEFKKWVGNPGSAPCCYNFMGIYKQIIRLEGAMCWSSIERCCNEFDNCFKTFENNTTQGCYYSLMADGVVEYGAIDDPDNICFLKTYLDDRYEDPDLTCTYLKQILAVGILIVCPVGGDEVWVLTKNTYSKWCEAQLP